jgi:cysteine desulfurase
MLYFDHAATTPPDEAVLETYDAVNRGFWANPQSLHRQGLRAEALMEQARRQVLELLGAANGYRCIFTSGATEANNMALVGAARLFRDRGKHIVASAVEHPSVLEVCRFLESEGWELSLVPVNAAGSVDAESLAPLLRPETAVVSLMHVNNETGSVNDIATLGALVKQTCHAAFHVDAAQSIGKFALELEGTSIDMLTFSAHKFFGLKGSGALILRDRLEIPPLIRGGGQEYGLRSGTSDTARAAALAKALRLAMDRRDEAFAMATELRAQIVEAFQSIPGTALNGSKDGSSPFIVNFSIGGVRPETLLQAMSERDIHISTVSACSTRKTAESAVVLALTGSHERAANSIRISLSAKTTQHEVDRLCETADPLIETLRLTRK